MSPELVDQAGPPPLEVLEELVHIELTRGRSIRVRVVRPRAGSPPVAELLLEMANGREPRSIWIGKYAARAVADAIAEFAARSW